MIFVSQLHYCIPRLTNNRRIVATGNYENSHKNIIKKTNYQDLLVPDMALFLIYSYYSHINDFYYFIYTLFVTEYVNYLFFDYIFLAPRLNYKSIKIINENHNNSFINPKILTNY